MKEESQKEKILLVSSIFPPEIGGPSMYVAHLFEEFKNLGYEVYTATYTKDTACVSFSGGSFLRMLRLFFYLVFHQKKYDVVITFNAFSTGLPCACASKFLRTKKWIVRVGGDYLWERSGEMSTLSEYYQKSKSFKEKVLIHLLQFSLQSFDKVIATETMYSKILMEKYSVLQDKLEVIKNPFPIVKRSEKDRKNFYLFAGRLVALKNPIILLKVIEQFDQVVLKILGSGPLKSQLTSWVKEHNLESRISISESVSQEELFDIMAQARAVIIPSFSEVSPNTLLEALALGTPVICTQETGYRDEYANVVSFFDPKNINQLVRAIEMHEDPNMYKDIVKKVNDVHTDYSFSDVASKFVNML
ncbi:MAG: hypothetical protein COV59_03765 [Candidatus Magasanikbacteria bacterium CG11_big_fil_rev_8_21_14_0_20_39_34]|uniref:Glycosyl transferase family 1 domain-containing protein n=1 Tax=Candidatus Magasanikbacteria bacterium CG11_big_fil_rev_8_21_14_0_20_39_34 TaxID=1974653 RepID=A0A2H0N4E3_9BACT|nr:MAG: hypothetical protein COV59_03765 [Candidatus Magasanikbacteria bacterium CG11_big_fil_rev_8_21_14_0_20_39_34]